jgi:hypothetical protein
MMLGANRKAQPAAGRVRPGFVRKLACEHEQLGSLLIGDHTQVRLWLPALEAHRVRKTRLLVEGLVSHVRNRARLPGELPGIDDDMLPLPARKLSQLDEQKAPGLGKGGMAKTFRIKEKSASRPVPVFIGENPLEHEYLLSLGVIVSRKSRMGLVTHNGRYLA